MLRYLKYGYLALGVALLTVVLVETDIAAVASRLRTVGWGIFLILAIYFFSFLFDVLAWLATAPSLKVDFKWVFRLFKVRLVGEAFNNTTPFATMGGEPLKAYLLKRRYGVGYNEGIASIILVKTLFMVALVLFLIVGFALMLDHQLLSTAYQVVAGLGLLLFGGIILGLFLFQRFKIASWVGARLSRWKWGRRVEGILHHVEDVDHRIVEFYTSHSLRLCLALMFSLFNWLLGMVELYVIMNLLGHELSWTDIWIIESFTQLVRAISFFIPAGIGAQEGAFVLMCSVLAGGAEIGLAAALLRRIREIIWIIWGLALGGGYLFKRERIREEVARRD